MVLMAECRHLAFNKMATIKTWKAEDFRAMDKHFRTQFFNSLTGFKSLNLVGTISKAGNPNLAVFAQVFHLGAEPSLIGMILRPNSVPRNTLQNIEETQVFTLNHVRADFVKQAHQTSAQYASTISEFDAVGLHELYTETLKAPYVQESDIRIGLKCIEKIRIESNQTLLIVGEVIEVMTPEKVVRADGFIDLHEAETLAVGGLDAYYSTQKLIRLSYAKPDKALQEIDF